MKKIKLLILSILFIFVGTINVYATSIDTIDMNITLESDGTATIVETWKATVNQGTEGWHPYYNLGDSEITVLGASMDGESYDIVNYWYESNTKSEKAYKAGLYNAGGGEYDVVFGVSEYGTHTYKVVYKISNFVKNLEDADMIYWQLFPYDFSAQPNNVTIKVSGPYYYPDDLDVWGFGMSGAPCYVKDGAIYMTSDGGISKSEYLTLLAKFPAGTFDTTSKLDNTFDYYLDMAKDGSKPYNGNSSSNSDMPSWAVVIMALFPILINVIVWSIIGTIFIRESNKNKKPYVFSENKNKIPKDINNFRDIPCNKDIYRAFWVADTYKLNKTKNDFFGVLLLKWIYDGNVTVNTLEKKKLLKTAKEDVITFNKEPETENVHERNLYRYMLEASGDGVLEKDEFKKWCKNHYSKILDWADKVLKYERDILVKEGSITDIVSQKGLVFKYDVHSYKIEDNMYEEAIQMGGLKKFLNEFSEINKKEPIEVKLWNEYLMYAQIFGIASKVIERFKKLYPEIVEDMGNYNFDYSTFLFINSISSTGVSAASAARSAANSYSGGGGGFSSGGGGGGSFGGGGGGGGFR